MFSLTRRTSAATAKLLLYRLTENVACYSFIFLLEIQFVNFSLGLFQEYLFYTTQFISWLPFVRNFQTECEFSEPTEQQQFVCGHDVPAKDVHTHVRALVTIKIGAKTKNSIQSTHCHVYCRGASPCLIVSSLMVNNRLLATTWHEQIITHLLYFAQQCPIPVTIQK